MKWVILLTTCVHPIRYSNNDEIENRSKLYLQQLNKWLSKTKFMIYLVESSNNGHIFNHLQQKYPNRLNIVSFDQKKFFPNKGFKIKSRGEALSVKHVMDEIMKNEDSCTHVFKVTGRYFLRNIEEKLCNINVSNDTILRQKHINHRTKHLNTEYYGMNKELMCNFIQSILDSKNLMEYDFYKFVEGKKNVLFGPFKNNIARGGDKIVIKEL